MVYLSSESTTGSNAARSDVRYYGDTSESSNIVTRLTVENMLGGYATKAEIPVILAVLSPVVIWSNGLKFNNHSTNAARFNYCG